MADDIEEEPLATVIYAGTTQALKGPVSVTAWYEDLDPSTGLGQLTLDLALDDGRYVITRVEAKGPDGGRLDIEALRRVTYATQVRRIVRDVLLLNRFPHDGGHADFWSHEHWLYEAREDPSLEPTMLERVAYFYTVGKLLGEHPTKMVAEAFAISSGAAAQRVSRARKAGLLLPLVSEDSKGAN